MNLIELGKLDQETIKKFNSDFRFVAAYAKYKDSPKQLRQFVQETDSRLNHPLETQNAIAAISGDLRYLEMEIEKEEEITMCKLYDMLMNEGIEKGVQQNKIENARNLLKFLDDTIISECVGLPLEMVKNLRIRSFEHESD